MLRKLFARHLLLFGIALVLGGCRGQGGTFVPKKDAGLTMSQTCNNTSDCGGNGLCVSGICQAVKSCTTDMDCAADHKVCHSRRFYCVECERQDQCPMGQTCQFDFTCVTIGASDHDGGTASGDGGPIACSGSCTDRTMCPSDQVCSNQHCCPPPARCFSPADCPQVHPECNGATGMCFGGDNCNNDMDCNTKPGCAGGVCVCMISGSPPGVCLMRQNECQSDNDCKVNMAYAGKYCTLQMPPHRCVTAPGCGSDADCAQLGLVCDTVMGSDSYGHCKNGTPCPTGNECASTEACVNQVCVPKNCLNTPSLCTSTQHCDAVTAMCVANTGGMCMIDTDCMAGYWCNTMMTPGTCQAGCRDNNDCGGAVCDANHQCQAGMGGVCGSCMSDADCPAGTHCLMGLNLCYQPCDAMTGMGCTLRPMSMCLFGNCTCFL
jgi:hypothetical protein